MTKRARRSAPDRTEVWTLLAIALVLLYRFPGRLLSPQLWAEDGTVFLTGQRDLGFSSLWTPYSGYSHLIPRLIALVSGSLLDLRYIPFAYNFAAFVLTLLCALFVMRARLPLPCKPLAAFALVFVPHPSEVYLTITSIQWMFAAVIPLFLLQPPATTRAGRIAEIVGVLLIGLTGPFLLLFSPILAYRIRRDGWRDRNNLLFCGAAVLAITLQASAGLSMPAPSSSPDFSPLRWLAVNGAVLIGGMLLGKNMSHFLMGENVAAYLRSAPVIFSGASKVFLMIGCVVAAIGILAFFWRGLQRLTPARRVLAVSLLFCAAVTLVAAMRRLQGDAQPLGPFSGGSRYCFLPYVCFAWTSLLFLSAGGVHGTVARLLLILEAVSTLSILGPPPPTQDFRWTESVSAVRRGEAVTVPIPPHGVNGAVWQIHLRPKTR